MAETERIGPTGWERVRALRLRALREAPDAFGRTLEEEEGLTRDAWQDRLECAATFLAVSGGEDIGMITCADYRNRAGAVGLFGMWVAPEWRRSGAAGRLVDEVVAWARSNGYERILLEVGDANIPAIHFYDRKGFVPTGATGTLPPPRAHILEHERVLELSGPSQRPQERR
jgi:GNAT superfamily N-acetyltransferase